MSRSNHHLIHRHSHPGYFYPVHIRQRVYGLVVVPLAVLLFAVIILQPVATSGHISIWQLFTALAASVARLIVAYLLAVVCAFPLALIISRGVWTERVLLPIFDVMQSVPVLAFFPIVIIFFLNHNFLEGAAVFVLFITMLWSMVFSLVGGLHSLPVEIKEAAQVFGIHRLNYFRHVLIPAVTPYFITGSLLSWASGWNILIVAEVLHTYLPGGKAADLYGIGSTLVHASAQEHQKVFLAAILVMILAIGLTNFFIWQKLLRYAERFRFE